MNDSTHANPAVMSRPHVTVDVYETVDQIPIDAQKLFAEAQAVNVELGLVWYRTLVETVFFRAKEARIFVLRHGGVPVAALPVRIEKRMWMKRMLSLSNYYTALYEPVFAPTLRPSDLLPLVRALCVDASPDSLVFSPLDPQSSAYHTLMAALRLAGLPTFAYFCFGNWHLRCPGADWDAYLASRSGGLRNTLRRLGKKFLADGGRFEIIATSDNLREGIAAFDKVYERRWKRPEPYPTFLPGLMKACANQGWLRLGIAWLGDRPVAAQLWIVAGGRAEIYKVAYDESFKHYSPGSLLTAELMRHVLQHDQVAEVDYLIGDDPYKESWMSHRRERWGLVAYVPWRLGGLTGLIRESLGRTVKFFAMRVHQGFASSRRAMRARQCATVNGVSRTIGADRA